jgi:uncharacterized protein (DUF1697 family)
MPTLILLLRGVNVGGVKLSMQAFRDYLNGLGFEDVRTYVQSGNAVVNGPLENPQLVRERVAERFAAAFGFQPQIMVLTADSLSAAIAGNPFPDAEQAPTTLHLGFMQGQPTPEAIEALKSKPHAGEEWRVVAEVFYLHAPLGLGKSVLASFIERTLKVPLTMRNWNTVTALEAMAQ